MPGYGWVIFALLGLVGLAACLGSLYVARARRRALARFAGKRGLSFKRSERLRVPKLMNESRLFLGWRLRARNVMRGVYRDREVLAFELPPNALPPSHTTLRRRGGWQENLLSVCLFRLPAGLPRLAVSPMNVLDADLFGFFRGDDRYNMQLESDAFNRTFRVQSDDRKFAFDVLSAEVMSWLLDHPGWAIDFAADWFVVRSGALWVPGDYSKVLDFGAGLLERVPEFVWQEYGERSAAEGSS